MARKVTFFIVLGLMIYETLLALTIRSSWISSTERQFREVGTQNAELGAQVVRYVLDRAVANGVFRLDELVDASYVPVDGSSPPAFHTGYDYYFDRNVREIQDGFLRASAISYAYAMTKDGYIPTSSVASLNKIRVTADLPAAGTQATQFRLSEKADGLAYYEYAAPIRMNDVLWGEFRVGIPKAVVDQQVDSKVNGSLMLTLGVSAALAVLMYLVVSRSLKPLVRLSELAERAAEGDLAAAPTVATNSQAVAGWRPWVMGKDEVSKLENSFGRMARNLRDMISSVQSASMDLSASTAQIAVTSKQAMATAAEQATTVQQVGATVEQIGQTSRVVVDRAQDVVLVAEQAVEGGQRGILAIAEAQKALELIARIMEIVDTVNELAEQSNLLAVNASIEASKAGEQGRGFGVVAGEVRSLANQSKKAAKQIREILGRIEASGAAVSAAHASITQLASVLEESAAKARQISGAASQQAAGIGQISDAMTNVVQGGKVTADGARQLESAASTLNALAQRMNSTLAGYRT